MTSRSKTTADLPLPRKGAAVLAPDLRTELEHEFLYSQVDAKQALRGLGAQLRVLDDLLVGDRAQENPDRFADAKAVLRSMQQTVHQMGEQVSDAIVLKSILDRMADD